MTVAAAEAAVGLAIIITIYRSRQSVDVEQVDSMQG
jgi:NADH-quinone oxidoreductase subunit K